MDLTPIVVDSVCNGPAHSGHGGWSAGLVARRFPGTATVSLRSAPPLDTMLTVVAGDDDTLRVFDGSTLVAEGRPADLDAAPPRPVDVAEAVLARTWFEEHVVPHHPFPTCFGCGPRRDPAEALRLFTGVSPSGDVVAAPWTVRDIRAQGAVTRELMWAAVDCATGWAAMALPDAASAAGPSVLANLTVRVDALPSFGDECVVVGWPIDGEGRKRHTGGAILSAEGATLAVADALWIELRTAPPADS
ncbi:MAG: hypothetical protein U0Q22_04680 [Acidimicrobiales bacterium]